MMKKSFLLFNLSDHHPEKMVVAVAIIADKITIKVVDKYAALLSEIKMSWANLAKYMFSTIHAIWPTKPKIIIDNHVLKLILVLVFVFIIIFS